MAGAIRIARTGAHVALTVVARFRALCCSIAARGGHVFHVVGDGFCAVFEHAADALLAALGAQRALQGENWGEVGPVRVRMGLHTGTAEARDGGYVASLTLARAQRVAAAGHGGQTLLSAAAASRVREGLPKGTTLRDLGVHKLRGLTEAHTHSAIHGVGLALFTALV